MKFSEVAAASFFSELSHVEVRWWHIDSKKVCAITFMHNKSHRIHVHKSLQDLQAHSTDIRFVDKTIAQNLWKF